MIVALIALLACGSYTPDDFREEVWDASCALAVDCIGSYENVAEYVADQEIEDTRGCVFDAGSAMDCVEGLQAARCNVGDALPDEPDACLQVWDCDA